MISADEDALICDLAETYGILNYKALPVSLLATLSAGLRENSRIKMTLNKMTVPTDTLLLASAVDKLALILWSKTEDGANGQNRPKSITAYLMGHKDENKDGVILTFDTAEDFENAREKILKGVNNGN